LWTYTLEKIFSSGYQARMKYILGLCASLALLCSLTRAQDARTNSAVRIPASEAKNNVGTNAIVTGKIAEVSLNEKLVRLNFDRPYPKQTFTAVIFAAKTNLFSELEKLKGQTVEVSGKINEFRGRCEIVLLSTNQLKVVSTPDKPATTPEAADKK
jgi:hypothetical protein